MRHDRENTTCWIFWGMVLGLYLVWPLTHLGAYQWTNDEGLYMQRAALANAGYPLYAETYFNKPPLLVWILRAVFHAAGPTLGAARLGALCLTMIGLVAVGMIARQLWGRWAGVTAMVTLLALPEFPVRAHVVMADLPPMSLALVAISAVILFQYRRRRRWLVLSGAALAGALLMHPLLIFSTLPVAIILFLPHLVLPADEPLQRAGWSDALHFLAPMAAAGLITLVAVDRRSFFAWVFQSNFRAARSVPLDENWEMLTGFLNSSWALIGLSTVSSVILSTSPERKRRALPLLAAWWLATFATLLVLTPLWSQYLILLSFPLAIVSAGGTAETGKWLLGLMRGESRRMGPRAVSAALIVVALVLFGVDRWEKTKPELLDGPEWTPDLIAAREFVEATVPPDGFVATDDALLAFAAGRLVQPPFTEASKKQIELGNFTTEDAVEGMLRYGAQAALFSTGRLTRLPGFEEWIAEVATERREFGGLRGYRLDLPRLDPSSTIARFRNGFKLRGYALSRRELRPGDAVTVMLFWRPEEGVPEDHHVFVHLIHEGGDLWGQDDGPPQDGERATGRWRGDALLFDVHRLEVSPEARPGRCRLSVGMYPWPSLERVAAFRSDGRRWPHNRVVVTELNVVSP